MSAAQYRAEFVCEFYRRAVPFAPPIRAYPCLAASSTHSTRVSNDTSEEMVLPSWSVKVHVHRTPAYVKAQLPWSMESVCCMISMRPYSSTTYKAVRRPCQVA